MEKIGVQGIFDLSQFERGLSGYTSGLGKAEGATTGFTKTLSKGWNDLGSTVTKATAIMGGAVVAAAGAATAAIGAFTVSGIQKAADLEAQLGGIAAVLSKTKDEVAPLKALILDLAVDPNLKVSAVEAADAVEMLARNGLDMTQIMGGAAKATVLLANATGADFGTAADIATDAMAIFKIDAENMIDAVNGITSVTTSSKFTIDDYALALAQGGGVAASVGVEFDDFNTSIAAMSPLFASGSDAGTSFKTLLSRLVPASKEAAAAQKALGLEFFNTDGTMKSMAEIAEELNRALMGQITVTQEVGGRTEEQEKRYKQVTTTIGTLQKSIADYQSGIKGAGMTEDQRNKKLAELNASLRAAEAEHAGLAGIQGQLVTSTKSLTEEEKVHYATVLFGSDAMRAAFGLAESGAVVYTDLATAMEETGLSQEVLTGFMADGKLTAFELLQAQQGLTDANKSAATRVENLKGQMEVFWSVVEGLQIQIGDKFLPILTEMAKMFTEFVSKHTPAIIAMFEKMSAGVEIAVGLARGFAHLASEGELLAMTEWGLSEANAALADKIALNILAVYDFTAGIWAATEPARVWLDSVLDLSDVLIVLGAAIASVVIPAIVGMIAAISPAILVFAGAVAAVASMRMAWESNFLGIQDVTTNAISSIQQVWGNLVAFFEPSIERLRNSFDVLGEKFGGLGEKFSALWAAASPVLTGLATLIGGVLVVTAVAAIETLSQLIASIADVVGVVVDQFTLLFTTISEAFTNVVALVSAVIAGDWAAAWESAGALAQTGVDLVTGTIGNLGTLFEIVFTGLRNIVVNTFSAFGVDIAALLPGFVAKVGEWGAAAVRWIIEAAPKGIAALGTFATALIANVGSRLSSWSSGWSGWAKAAWDWISGAVSSATTALGSFVSSLTTNLATRLQSWRTAFTDWATAAWQWIVDSTGNLPGKIGEWYTSLSSALSAKLSAWQTAFTEWAEAAWQWIIDAKDNLAGKIGEWYTALDTALDGKLGDWQTAFEDWKEATWEWITDSATQLPGKILEWYNDLKDNFATRLPTFKVEMLKWATALVEWIGDKAADALPELGKWLGKILAWIPLGVLSLAAGLIKMAAALVGWIAGGEGTAAGDSAAGQTDEAMDAFQEALLKALEQIRQGFIEGVQEFVTAWSETMTEHVDWQQLGQDIMTWVKDGIASLQTVVVQTVTDIVTASYAAFTSIDWTGLGSDIIRWVIDGISSMAGALASQAQTMARSIRDGFTSIDWAGIGKSVIEGVWSGMDSLKGWLEGKISGLTDALPQWVKEALGISSPSKVFAEIGRNMIQGWLEGMEREYPRLLSAIDRMVGSVRQRAMQVGGPQPIASALSGLFGVGRDFADHLRNEAAQQRIWAGHAWAVVGDWQDAARRMNKAFGMESIVAEFEGRQGIFERLQQRLELIEAIRNAGGNPADVLAGIDLVNDYSTENIVRAINKTTEFLTNQLANSIRAAQQDVDGLIKTISAGRKPIEEIERAFNPSGKSSIEIFRDRIGSLDEQIASTEQRMRAFGDVVIGIDNQGTLTLSRRLAELNAQRAEQVALYQRMLETQQQMQQRINLLNDMGSGRTKSAVEEFQRDFIDPLVLAFERSTDPASRANLVRWMGQRIDQLNGFVQAIGRLKEIPDFIDGTHLEAAMERIFSVHTGADERGNLINQVNRYIDQMRALQNLQRDISGASKASPFVDQFVAARLDPLLKKIQDINTTEAERWQLAQQYRMEQEKILAIQEKQQRLDFLSQQMSMLDQIRKLAEDSEGAISLDSILGGVRLGMGASLDDLLAVTGRMIDAMISEVNKKLQIRSPSKVFAQIGEYMMQGLGQGIEQGMMRPAASMARAASNVAYAPVSNRNATVNFGGVNIHSGMDEVVFAARVRNVVQDMLN